MKKKTYDNIVMKYKIQKGGDIFVGIVRHMLTSAIKDVVTIKVGATISNTVAYKYAKQKIIVNAIMNDGNVYEIIDTWAQTIVDSIEDGVMLGGSALLQLIPFIGAALDAAIGAAWEGLSTAGDIVNAADIYSTVFSQARGNYDKINLQSFEEHHEEINEAIKKQIGKKKREAKGTPPSPANAETVKKGVEALAEKATDLSNKNKSSKFLKTIKNNMTYLKHKLSLTKITDNIHTTRDEIRTQHDEHSHAIVPYSGKHIGGSPLSIIVSKIINETMTEEVQGILEETIKKEISAPDDSQKEQIANRVAGEIMDESAVIDAIDNLSNEIAEQISGTQAIVTAEGAEGVVADTVGVEGIEAAEIADSGIDFGIAAMDQVGYLASQAMSAKDVHTAVFGRLNTDVANIIKDTNEKKIDDEVYREKEERMKREQTGGNNSKNKLLMKKLSNIMISMGKNASTSSKMTKKEKEIHSTKLKKIKSLIIKVSNKLVNNLFNKNKKYIMILIKNQEKIIKNKEKAKRKKTKKALKRGGRAKSKKILGKRTKKKF